MVPGGELTRRQALERRQRVWKEWQPKFPRLEVRPVELVDHLRRELEGQVLVLCSEDVDGEAVRLGEAPMAVGGRVEADQDPGRLQGQGGEGARGEPPLPTIPVDRGDDRDARRELPHRLQEQRLVDTHRTPPPVHRRVTNAAMLFTVRKSSISRSAITTSMP